GGKNSLNRLIRCVCGKKIGPDPRNFNQRVSLGRNDLLIRTFPRALTVFELKSSRVLDMFLARENKKTPGDIIMLTFQQHPTTVNPCCFIYCILAVKNEPEQEEVR
ncbi:hypothetical protein, partial [Klebsiella quasipneumoniae]|uniref:hypothetical protein n=1 Tax=Klebsiella quasipneumoniae TaxID=1463165 RepID=UPI002B0560DF